MFQLQRLREWLSLLLLAALPFHALLVTVLTTLIAGPGHAPLSVLAVWKEGVLGVILSVTVVEIMMCVWREARSEKREAHDWLRSAVHPLLRFDFLDVMILGLLVLSVIVTTFTHGNWTLYLFGFRYDFVPLVAFVLLRRVPWSEWFMHTVMRALLVVGVSIALYGLIGLLLPSVFFSWLGYSDLHSLYVADKPIAAFQMIGGTALRRMQSVMSGPNQLGVWLLIPLAVLCSWMSVREVRSEKREARDWLLSSGYCLLFLVALLLTFSRSAWIGALVMLVVACWPLLRRMSRTVLVGVASTGFIAVIVATVMFPSVLLRISSTRGHIEGPLQALEYMIQEPFGHGMGMAGPASNRVSDACVLLREGDDPSWAADRPDLCVFVGDIQVQPEGRACSCPLLPENWYLQIGVEMGWVGLVLYLLLMVGVMTRLLRGKREAGGRKREAALQKSVFLAFIGVSVVALFLHAFEDAAAAYTLWVMAAVVIGQRGNV